MQEIGARRGPRPRTSTEVPQQQLDQQPAGPAPCEELARRAFALPGVLEAPSDISLPGARALMLAGQAETGPAEAFIAGREFAHLHPAPDHSLHLALPSVDAECVVALGWAEWHPRVLQGRWPRTVVLVYAPRDPSEVDAVSAIVRRSWEFASGRTARADPPWA
jgi:hypothetical protein